ncbi:MAG TPA: TonB-dependent receptor [Bryobacteraceae bacterium]|nr:TonB-dependent receptor [Bryobacteraceae bacterium]
MRWSCTFFVVIAVLSAQTLGTVRGIVHDPQHRPLENATVTLGAKTAQSDSNGDFTISDVPEGPATLRVSAEGFAPFEEQISVTRDKSPVLHLQLELAEVKQTVEVSGALSKLNAQTATVQTSVTPQEIIETPGADQTNSLAMITDFTPGAYMVHDMLHMRGGHQVNWFLDGIPVVNTSIAANVAPLVNPKNVAELEVERGGFSSQYGDRTYGFFNAVTPSGFERNNDAELIASLGTFWTTDDQFNVGSHTQRFAYYASVDGSRSELGLSTPVSQVIHDQTSGVGGFLSLMYNATPKDQLRWVVSLRENHYQIPNAPDQQDAGIRDLDLERDYLAGFYWMHTFSDGVLFTVSPYFHFNDAHYVGGPQDMPFILDDNNQSNYFGARPVLQVQKGKHNARIGLDVWWQHDNSFFGLVGNPTGGSINQQVKHWANSNALFLEDQYRVRSWLTLDLGLRLTHYDGLVNENAADPRVGGSIRIPRINWVLHGYWAYYYQPPPLDSLSGPLLQFALAQGYGFIPLAGERDIQHDIGLSIPVRTWTLELDYFHTSARNFLDHDVVGNSGIFIPLTDLGAIISGTEITVRSPQLFHRAQLRLAYSNQIAQGIAPITGGLLEFAGAGNFLLDHDQRNTATAVLSITLPKRMWMTPAYQFGSGFLNGDGPAHLPPHSTFDLSIGKKFGEKWTLSANAVNIANTRYLLDTSNTFGGTHYISPREIYGEVRYRFKF